MGTADRPEDPPWADDALPDAPPPSRPITLGDLRASEDGPSLAVPGREAPAAESTATTAVAARRRPPRRSALGLALAALGLGLVLAAAALALRARHEHTARRPTVRAAERDTSVGASTAAPGTSAARAGHATRPTLPTSPATRPRATPAIRSARHAHGGPADEPSRRAPDPRPSEDFHRALERARKLGGEDGGNEEAAEE